MRTTHTLAIEADEGVELIDSVSGRGWAPTSEIVTRAHLEAIKDLVGNPENVGAADHALQYLNTVPTGGRVPFFSELRFDDSGRLWIADYVPSGWPCIGSRGEGVYRILHELRILRIPGRPWA